MTQQRLLIRSDLRSTVLASVFIKWKIIVFHVGRWFFIDNFLIWETQKQNDTIVYALSSRFKTSPFWPWRVNFKIWPQVRSTSGHDWSRSISFEAACECQYLQKRHIFLSGMTSQVLWHHLCVSISILSRVIDEKRIVTSFHFRWPSRDPPNHKLQ